MTARGIVQPGSSDVHEAVADALLAEVNEYLEAVEFFRAEGCDIIPRIVPAPEPKPTSRWGVWRWSVGG